MAWKSVVPAVLIPLLKRIGSVKKYKLADKNASLTALEKHLGLYKDDSGDNVPLHIHLHL